MPPNYTYRAEWDPARCEFQARCLEFPGRFASAFTAHEAVAGMENIVAEELAERTALNEGAPPSLTDRYYSGKFLVRTSSTLHSRLVVEANEQGVSLNQWVVTKLAEHPRAVGVNDLFD